MSADEFLAKELDHVRQVYADAIQEISTIERYSVAAAAAIWSWCAAHITDPGVSTLLWLPVAVAILFGLRAWGIFQRMSAASSYLLTLERRMKLPAGIGWEHHRAPSTRLRTVTGFLFWALFVP